MTRTSVTRKDFEHYALSMLDDESLEEFMERYDLEPVDVLLILYDEGYIDFEYEDNPMSIDEVDNEF